MSVSSGFGPKITKQRRLESAPPPPVPLNANLAPPSKPLPISTEQWQGDGDGVGAEQGVAWGRVEGAMGVGAAAAAAAAALGKRGRREGGLKGGSAPKRS